MHKPGESSSEPLTREIDELREQVDALGAGWLHRLGIEGTSPGTGKAFWEQVLRLEQARQTTHFEQLRQSGIELPAPEELDDGALVAKLWEVIHALEARSVYLTGTDHLSDRQLYTRLWRTTLHSETYPLAPNCGTLLDLLDSEGKNDEAYLAYYASDLARSMRQAHCPEEAIPDRRSLPYDRDRLLPRPPFAR